MQTEKDAFWTSSYRGTVIQGYYDRELKKEVIKALMPDGEWIQCSTLRGARARISRHIGGRPKL